MQIEGACEASQAVTATRACGGASLCLAAAVRPPSAAQAVSTRALRLRRTSMKGATKGATTAKRATRKASKPAFNHHGGGEDSDAPRPEVSVGRFQALLDDEEEYGAGVDSGDDGGGMTT